MTLLNLIEFTSNHSLFYVKHHRLPFQIPFLTVYEFMELYRHWGWITLLCDVVSGSRHGCMNRRRRDFILNHKLKQRKQAGCTQGIFKNLRSSTQWLTSFNKTAPPTPHQTMPPIGNLVFNFLRLREHFSFKALHYLNAHFSPQGLLKFLSLLDYCGNF